jgi:thiopurine S-methyltransferase
MENEFWIKKWDENQIGFHQDNYNQFLVNHWEAVVKSPGAVLVPLCGKSRDLIYLSKRSKSVLGVELSEKAIVEFFYENELKYEKKEHTGFDIYNSGNISLIRGDLFTIPKDYFEGIDSVYDRACIVALPPELRSKYINFINQKLSHSHYFLQTLAFDDAEAGPPFCIALKDVKSYFQENFTIGQIDSKKLIGEDINVHKDKVSYLENLVFHLERRH